nr:copper resistance protein CopC [Paenibacillus lemnae]
MFIAVLLIVSFPSGALAHSKLVTASPSAETTTTENVTELLLTFNEKIDPTLSTLIISGTDGQSAGKPEITVEEDQLKAVFDKPLDSGTYEVEWKIVSGDSHPVSGTYTFAVEAPETPAAPEENTSEEAPTANEENADTPAAPEPEPNAEPEQQPQTSSEDNNNGSGVMLWVVVIIVIAAAGALIILRQSRSKR